jgi:transcriptional regulator with XRE-family HTH domain
MFAARGALPRKCGGFPLPQAAAGCDPVDVLLDRQRYFNRMEMVKIFPWELSMRRLHANSAAEPRRVMTGAVMRAAALLEITQSHLAAVLGISASTVSRMANGAYSLDDHKKEWELGALFVRLFRSLDALVGSNDAAARLWLAGGNRGLAARPIDLIGNTEGLVRVVQYLDCARGRL